MHIVTVTILRGAKKPLTYFSNKRLREGMVVTVPLRNRPVPAFVEKIEDLATEKASIKAASFGMKKILKIVNDQPYTESYLKAAKETAEYFSLSVGSVLSATTPLSAIDKIAQKETREISYSAPDVAVLQAQDDDRLGHYKSLVRETFSRGKSVFLLVPTVQDAKTISLALSKGIEKYVIALHGENSAKSNLQSIKKIASEKHPLLLITTPGFISCIPESTGLFIVERENSSAYRHMAPPFMDFRRFALSLAKYSGVKAVIGDIILQISSMHQLIEGGYSELVHPKWRMTSQAQQSLVDMRSYKPDIKGTCVSLSKELLDIVKTTRESGGRTFIFVARKGLAPSTICSDCGEIVRCQRCQASLVLHMLPNKKRIYLCHRCGLKTDASLRCGNCTSWKLSSLGFGIQQVEEELTASFPTLKILRLDKDSALSKKNAEKIISDFYESPGAVLIGTEFSLSYLSKKIASCAVSSIDEMFSIPDFRMNEKAMYLMLKLRSICENYFLLQTRNADVSIIKDALDGNLSSFYKNEIEVRKSLLYPPFSVLVKITAPSSPENNALMKNFAEKFKPYDFDIFPLMLKKAQTMHISGIVKIPQKEWPNVILSDILQSMPAEFDITVDPERII